VTADDAREILNAQRRFAKPVAIRVPDGDAVHAARQIAAEFPAMKFVLLGMGGEDWRLAVTAAKQHLNLYLEISGSLDSDKVAQASSVITPRKLLYGSGLPQAAPELTLALVESAPTLTRADRNRILSENAVALLRTDMQTAPGEDGADG
jgi:predicted TIM-barrel fold metal-dependent hydrolase